MEKGKKVTIYDIARLSGFSPKTVSRVINGGNRVKPETYNAIKKVIDELSYIPNAYAQNLTKKETTNILKRGGAVGRKLDFMMQELNRESNTLASKSINADITASAVELKVLIEQMREQIQNLE